jgi:multidrug efflux system membrane fusion protein
VGVTDGDYVSVRGELEPGDKVVTDGIDRLREGAQVTVVDSEKVKKVDQAVQDAANQPRGMMRNLSPEQREKVSKMTPEERKEFFQKLRAERGANGGNAARPGTAWHGRPWRSAARGAGQSLQAGPQGRSQAGCQACGCERGQAPGRRRAW